MSRVTTRFLAVAIAASLASGCAAGHGDVRPLLAPISAADEDGHLTPHRVKRSDVTPAGEQAATTTDTMLMIRRHLLKTLTPLTLAFSVLSAAPAYAIQQLDPHSDDKPLVRRSTSRGQRRTPLAFVRTELFFGTAKPGGVVTEEEFDQFLDEVVAPLFPEGLTVVKTKGRFRGADGVTVKEDSYVLVLLYPVEDRKANNRNIDLVRNEYMRLQQQESVLRVDDPFLVWVSL